MPKNYLLHYELENGKQTNEAHKAPTIQEAYAYAKGKSERLGDRFVRGVTEVTETEMQVLQNNESL